MLLTRRATFFAHRACHVLQRQPCRYASDEPFGRDDVVLLRQITDRTAPPILTKPLTSGKTIQNHKGVIKHDDILGKYSRETVSAVKTTRNSDGTVKGRKETQYRAQTVKLEEYVRLSRRLVTPIYPADAAVIVELLDIHLETPGHCTEDLKLNVEMRDRRRPLEILEAGTGHGALTLYLARAIHGANMPLWAQLDRGERDGYPGPVRREEMQDKRLAIVHSVEVSDKYSEHAQQVVAGFRQGLYRPNVDFHVGDVSRFLDTRGAEFLQAAFLDLPNADTHLGAVAEALEADATLVVFNPSITQIMDCVKRIGDEGIELELEKVVELGTNGGSGGREWDVRAVKPRKKTVDAYREGSGSAGTESASDSGEAAGAGPASEAGFAVSSKEGEDVDEVEDTRDLAPTAPVSEKDEWKMVCRPKVGDRVVGGGFLGVWKKKRASPPPREEEDGKEEEEEK